MIGVSEGSLTGVSHKCSLRQEIDGPQAEQLEMIAGAEEELSPAQIRDKETTYSSFWRSRRPS